MELLVVWLGFAIGVGAWASARGRSGFGWFLLAVLLSPLLAAFFLLIAGPQNENVEAQAIASGSARKCPFCAELIRHEAIVCKHCGRDVPASPPAPWQCESCGTTVRDPADTVCPFCSAVRRA
jgi:hypothetical protein